VSSSVPGEVVFLREHMEEPATLPFASGELQVFSRRTPAMLRANEDGALIVDLGDGRGVLAVADGMGGAPQGDLAAEIALLSLRDALRDGERELREAVLDGIERANARILEKAPGSGATIAVVQLEPGRIRSHHVGDAAVVICGQRGRLKHSTTSHSPVGYALEAGVLSEDEAMVHAERHVVSNAVGTPSMHIEIGPPIAIAPRDTVVIASDGVFDNLRLEEIVEIVRAGPLRRAAKRIAEQAARRMQDVREDHPGKPDDCTFVLFRPTAGKRR
jgi:serine/threonine protein phosphatase PrpC